MTQPASSSPAGRSAISAAFHELRRDRDRLIVTRWDPDGQEVTCYIFPVGPDGQWWLLASCQDVSGQGIDVERDGAGRIRAIRQRREKRGYRLVYNRDGRVVEVHLTTPARAPVIASPGTARLALLLRQRRPYRLPRRAE